MGVRLASARARPSSRPNGYKRRAAQQGVSAGRGRGQAEAGLNWPGLLAALAPFGGHFERRRSPRNIFLSGGRKARPLPVLTVMRTVKKRGKRGHTTSGRVGIAG
eukprot:scaffold212_cov404-Prasinococcus_capsulatus_cf.AAC.14